MYASILTLQKSPAGLLCWNGAGAMHVSLTRAVNEAIAAGQERLLWARQSNMRVLVYSRSLPNWDEIAKWDAKFDHPELRVVTELRQPPARWQSSFVLHASPVWRRDGEKIFIEGAEAQLVWLARQGDKFGFRAGAKVVDETVFSFRGKRTSARINRVTFRGELEVTDPEAFWRGLQSGIGTNKAWGMGLLQIEPFVVNKRKVQYNRREHGNPPKERLSSYWYHDNGPDSGDVAAWEDRHSVIYRQRVDSASGESPASGLEPHR